MKNLLFVLASIWLSITSFAQAPDNFNYQAALRNTSGTLLSNQSVGLQFSILQGSTSGTLMFQETFTLTTNSYGLINATIGAGTLVSGDISTIDWSAGPYFLETAVDETGGTT